jgi:L-lactate dehydrogenase complex protein LldG
VANSLEQNAVARGNVLARIRKALSVVAPDPQRVAAARDYVAGRAQGPRPAMPADLVARFAKRAHDMASTVERIAGADEIPHAVARYLDALDLPAAISDQRSKLGVCWPEFADLDWSSAGCRSRHGPHSATTGSASPDASARLPKRARW